jgi:hypothetical protein
MPLSTNDVETFKTLVDNGMLGTTLHFVVKISDQTRFAQVFGASIEIDALILAYLRSASETAFVNYSDALDMAPGIATATGYNVILSIILNDGCEKSIFASAPVWVESDEDDYEDDEDDEDNEDDEDDDDDDEVGSGISPVPAGFAAPAA